MREFLTPEQRASVKAIADRQGVTMADVLRSAVRCYLADGDLANIVLTSTAPVRAVAERPLVDRLKAARAERHMSLRRLANIIPVRPDELSRFETGKLVLSEYQIAAIEGWLTT